MTDPDLILTEVIGKVGLVRLNRPRAYNALNPELLTLLMDSLDEYDHQPGIGAMVVTGNEKAFAAGADISSMVDSSPEDMEQSPFIPTFSRILSITKPVLAAVSGFCLGGGLELAMSCDLIVASESAVFGQPEINLGIIPGAGGTQRLTHAVGKGLAMEMILNNRTLSGQEALSFGLVNHVFSQDDYLTKTLSLAEQIAGRAPLALAAAKQAVNSCYENFLTEGLDAERTLFYSLFDTKDQQEGMQAFLEKRAPHWKGK